jgi:glycosyltransferase involved in cell wall biosynthesis
MSSQRAGRRLTLRRIVTGPHGTSSPAAFTPTRVLVVDAEQPLPAIEAGRTPDGRPYGAAEVLVRLHARPLGSLTLDLTGGSVPPGRLRELIDARWADVIDRHLASHDHENPAQPQETCALSPAPMNAVSVIVPTCRRPDDVARCVDSILATTYSRLEVIVVDNAPSDPRTAALIADRYAGDDRVRYLREPTPGASRARNLGVRHAQGEIVAFADDDVVVDRHWVAALAAALHAHPEAHCVTGLVLPVALDNAVQWGFEQYGGFNRGYEPRMFDLVGRRGDTRLYPYTAGSFGGLGNAAFRRSALRQPDAFDETLGPGGPAFGAEDLDAFVTLLRGGGRLLYEPAALVRHRHREQYADLRWQVFTYGAAFTAALVHWSLRERAVALELLRRVPAVLPIAFGLQRSADAPDTVQDPSRRVLSRLELWGFLYGPVAYARAVRWRRRLARTATGRSGKTP